MNTRIENTEKTCRLLYAGSDERPYCAFPSLLETDDGVLMVWKQGTAHMRDEGVTAYAQMTKDGTICDMGIAAAEAGYNTQNAELLRMPNGAIRCYLDIQNYKNGKERMGTIVYAYRDGVFSRIPGILTDTDGKQYGYVFDGVEYGGAYYMLAMTFPELDYPQARRAVSLLVSEDNGETWRDVTEPLRRLFPDAQLNESTLTVMDGKLYVLCRSYSYETYCAVLDDSLTVVGSAVWGEADGVWNIGRPKLFARDGALYAIMRNHKTASSPMELILVKIHAETLRVEKMIVLDDDAPRDGYYAEHYFDGNSFCVVTYKMAHDSTAPDLWLLTFDWNALTA